MELLNDTLVVIPARGGSKGVPKKNIKLLGGKPLIEYSLDFASKFFDKDDICVSTDSQEIKCIVENWGLDVPLKRPTFLATDDANTRDVLIHALSNFNQSKQYKYVLLLQPTSPFRSIEDFKTILKLKKERNYDMIVSVRETKSNPYFNLFEEKNGSLRRCIDSDYTRRQDAPKIYEFNGAFYLIDVASLTEKWFDKFTKILKVVNNNSLFNVDIDTVDDWDEAERLLIYFNGH